MSTPDGHKEKGLGQDQVPGETLKIEASGLNKVPKGFANTSADLPDETDEEDKPVPVHAKDQGSNYTVEIPMSRVDRQQGSRQPGLWPGRQAQQISLDAKSQMQRIDALTPSLRQKATPQELMSGKTTISASQGSTNQPSTSSNESFSRCCAQSSRSGYVLFQGDPPIRTL